MTDKDIVSIIKQDIVNGHTGNFLTLDVIDIDNRDMMCFSENSLDDMVCSLFNLSLTKNIETVKSRRYGIDEYGDDIGFKSYNGHPFPIIGYTFGVKESVDHNTNITPMLLKFLEVVLRRAGLDLLAFPMGREMTMPMVKGMTMTMPMVIANHDPWVTFETYLRDE